MGNELLVLLNTTSAQGLIKHLLRLWFTLANCKQSYKMTVSVGGDAVKCSDSSTCGTSQGSCG